MQPTKLDDISSLSLSSHILDISLGKPAENVKITLHKFIEGQWITNDKNCKLTNSDGRAKDFQKIGDSKNGVYKLKFDVDEYFKKTGSSSRLYPFIEVTSTHI